jgi:hypothetical protein
VHEVKTKIGKAEETVDIQMNQEIEKFKVRSFICLSSPLVVEFHHQIIFTVSLDALQKHEENSGRCTENFDAFQRFSLFFCRY